MTVHDDEYVSFTTQYPETMIKRIDKTRKKIGVRSRAEAIRYLVDKGLKKEGL